MRPRYSSARGRQRAPVRNRGDVPSRTPFRSSGSRTPSCALTASTPPSPPVSIRRSTQSGERSGATATVAFARRRIAAGRQTPRPRGHRRPRDRRATVGPQRQLCGGVRHRGHCSAGRPTSKCARMSMVSFGADVEVDDDVRSPAPCQSPDVPRDVAGRRCGSIGPAATGQPDDRVRGPEVVRPYPPAAAPHRSRLVGAAATSWVSSRSDPHRPSPPRRP